MPFLIKTLNISIPQIIFIKAQKYVNYILESYYRLSKMTTNITNLDVIHKCLRCVSDVKCFQYLALLS